MKQDIKGYKFTPHTHEFLNFNILFYIKTELRIIWKNSFCLQTKSCDDVGICKIGLVLDPDPFDPKCIKSWKCIKIQNFKIRNLLMTLLVI